MSTSLIAVCNYRNGLPASTGTSLIRSSGCGRGYAPGLGILQHVGRKSGKQYRTPLNVFPTDDGVAILLTYGPDRDWLKNDVTATGRARIWRMGKTIELADPRVATKAEAAARVTGFWRPIFARLPFEPAVLLTRR